MKLNESEQEKLFGQNEGINSEIFSLKREERKGDIPPFSSRRPTR